jgi:hypothetical protein
VTELTFLKQRHKGTLNSYGSLPKSELDTETLELLDKTDNASLDVTGAKQLVFQQAPLALHQITEANAKPVARRKSMALQGV